MGQPPVIADTFLRERLAAAITLRRRQFRYWQRHSFKLATSDFAPGDGTTTAAAISAECQNLANIAAAARIGQALAQPDTSLSHKVERASRFCHRRRPRLSPRSTSTKPSTQSRLCRIQRRRST
jgi:hypothetical protein